MKGGPLPNPPPEYRGREKALVAMALVKISMKSQTNKSTISNFSTSTSPRSVSFNAGITSRAMKLIAMKRVVQWRTRTRGLSDQAVRNAAPHPSAVDRSSIRRWEAASGDDLLPTATANPPPWSAAAWAAVSIDASSAPMETRL